MKTLRETAAILEGPGDPVQVDRMRERAGFFACSLRTLGE